MLVKVSKETVNYIEFGFIMAGLPTIVRLENLLRKKDILDFHETKNIKSVEYNSIDEMIESGWRISPPHN